jgi:16S rRNA processing protein RimM
MMPDADTPATPEYLPPAKPDYLVVGQITKPHGTKGELFVWPLTDRPDDVFVPGRELYIGDEDGEVSDEASIVVIESVRPFKDGLLVKLQETHNRDDVASIARLYFLLPIDALPPLDEGEVFYHELLGMNVVLTDGAPVGTVREVFETNPHHLLEVMSDAGKPILIPFAERIVQNVDRDTRTITIDPPEGLLDL